MSKTIRDSSPTLAKMEEVIAAASAVSIDSDLDAMAKALSPILDLPDLFNAAFVPEGWVFVEFCCGIKPAQAALDMRREGRNRNEIDVFLSQNLINITPLYCQTIKLLGGGIVDPAHPVRAKVVERAFEAYHNEDFIVCTPLLLILIDSFGISETGYKSPFSDLSGLDDLFENSSSIGGHPSGLKSVLSEITRSKTGYSEELISSPYRNGVLHGTRLNYANRVVATKALCVLAAIIEWARDSAEMSQDRAKRLKWNRAFLTQNLCRLQPLSPEHAFSLFQGALDCKKPNEAVALIDYDPFETHLQSKLREWCSVLETAKISIVLTNDWEIIGHNNDKEQHGRCNIKLTVREINSNITSTINGTLYAHRQPALSEMELGHMWQVGLSILGDIRRAISDG